MQRAVILLDFLPNHRFTKRIEFEKDIFDLHLVCRNRGTDARTAAFAEGYTVHEFKIKSTGNPLKRLPQYFLYARKVSKLLNNIKPNLIHVQGIDMLKIAYAYKKKHPKVKVIYEVGDLHKLIVDKQTNLIYRVAQLYLRNKERHIASCSDMLIVTSMKFFDIHFSKFISKDKLLYMPNVPDMRSFAEYRKKNNGPFTVGFIGNIRYKKQIKNLIVASDKLNINLVIAGYEAEPKEIEALCENKKNIELSGRFDFNSQAAELYGKCDIIFSVYDADMENVKVALPNKLYEAIYCEIPIIVAKNTYLAELVESWGVGVAVDHKSVDDLIVAINSLKNNNEMYRRIVDQCRKRRNSIDLGKNNQIFLQRINDMFT